MIWKIGYNKKCLNTIQFWRILHPVYEGKKSFKYEICDAKYDLKIHTSSTHDKKSHLNAKFVFNIWKYMVPSVHEWKKPFKCEICGAK